VDKAFLWLDKACDERDSFFLSILVPDPIWDPLRSDPRYDALLRRMGLPR
jgi:hypothetical protein